MLCNKPAKQFSMGIPPAKTMETNPCNVLQDLPSAVEPANYYTAGTSEQEETIDSDRPEPRRTHTNIPSSRDPSGNGIEYHHQL